MAPSCYDDDVKHTSIWNQEEASVDASVVTDWLPHKPNLDHKNSDHIVVQGLGHPGTLTFMGGGIYLRKICQGLARKDASLVLGTGCARRGSARVRTEASLKEHLGEDLG